MNKVQKDSPTRETIKVANINAGWMEGIKKSLKNVTFIGFQQEKDLWKVKVIVKNNLGGKDTVLFSMETTPKGITGKEWNYIYETLKEKGYDGGDGYGRVI